MASITYRDVDGINITPGYSEDVVRSAFTYQPGEDDVFIASYPKCGTTWIQHIVYYIFSRGEPPSDHMEFMSRTPFLEFIGSEGVTNLSRPAGIKTHLPFHKVPFSDHSRYIYITRNPFDCCVSFYYHAKHLSACGFQNGTFDEFFELFLKGHVEIGDYFTHLLSWYKERNRSNVLFMTYEDLKKDTSTWILKVADFLGAEYGRKLREDPTVLERILEFTSIQHMKRSVNGVLETLLSYVRSTPLENLPPALVNFAKCVKDGVNKPTEFDFVRKGEIGDWRNHFSPDQTRRMRDWIALRTVGSNVMDLWKDLKFH